MTKDDVFFFEEKRQNNCNGNNGLNPCIACDYGNPCVDERSFGRTDRGTAMSRFSND